MANILLIDDDPLILAYLSRILQGEGHSVSGVTGGISALAQYEALRPDLVIADVWMPVQDGFETLRAIRKIDPKAKVVTCSGHPSYHGRRLGDVAAECGASAFIAKPFSARQLIDLVNRILAENGDQPTLVMAGGMA